MNVKYDLMTHSIDSSFPQHTGHCPLIPLRNIRNLNYGIVFGGVGNC